MVRAVLATKLCFLRAGGPLSRGREARARFAGRGMQCRAQQIALSHDICMPLQLVGGQACAPAGSEVIAKKATISVRPTVVSGDLFAVSYGPCEPSERRNYPILQRVHSTAAKLAERRLFGVVRESGYGATSPLERTILKTGAAGKLTEPRTAERSVRLGRHA